MARTQTKNTGQQVLQIRNILTLNRSLCSMYV